MKSSVMLAAVTQKAKVTAELPKTVEAAVKSDRPYSGFKIYKHKMEFRFSWPSFERSTAGDRFWECCPQDLSTYYFVVEAVDGYNVVFCWKIIPQGKKWLG